MSLRTRLAPTPSGYLHLGNALSFVVTWALARAQDGWILLRIDDLDTSRRRMKYLEDIFRTIEWLGIDYDEGPGGPDELLRSYTQQLRLPFYQEALQQLREAGHLYACTCSRKDIRARNTNGNHSDICAELHKPLDAPKTNWRVRVSGQEKICFREWNKGMECVDLGEAMGDFLVRRKNRAPGYQIASLMDDKHWDINFLVRGADLMPSTAAQIYLAKLLNYPDFEAATFWHHGLITGADGRKLSKSKGADAIKSWREAGKSPAPIFQMAADWLDLRETSVTNAQELRDLAGRHFGSAK